MGNSDSALESYLDLVPTGVHSVLSHPDVRRAIARYKRTAGKNPIVAENRNIESLAHEYLSSIIPRTEFPGYQLAYLVLLFCAQWQFKEISIQKEDVEKLRKAAKDGGFTFATTHYSLFDTPIVPYIFRRYGIVNEPVYIGGTNLMEMGKSPISRFMEYLISNANTSFIERASSEIPIVLGEIVKHYFEHLLYNRHNIVYFGSVNGCDKRGIIESRKSPILDVFKKVVPVAITYETIPEGEDYAERLMSDDKKPGRTFNDGFKMVRLFKRYETVHVRVGEEISAVRKKELDDAIVGSLQKLITITPTNLFAAAVMDVALSATQNTYLAVLNKIFDLKQEALRRGLPVSAYVSGKRPEEISDIAMHSVFGGLIKFHDTYIEMENRGLIPVYSNMVAHYFGRKPLLGQDKVRNLV